MSMFSRDSALWSVLFYGGLICVGLSLLDPDAAGFPEILHGIWPWLKFVAAIAAIVGGKMGNAPAIANPQDVNK
ncbi:MAG: hypothetical protein ACM3NQ_01305 [Bacteroidales bacterium]